MKMQEKKTITFGKAWLRYLLIPFILVFIFGIFVGDFKDGWTFVLLFISIGLFLWIKRARKLKHDDTYFYIIHGKKEKAIHFSNITSIKKSKAKVNGSRYWILRYKLEDEVKVKKCRFFSSFDGKFHGAVRKVNPEVVIWTHPHFNH